MEFCQSELWFWPLISKAQLQGIEKLIKRGLQKIPRHSITRFVSDSCFWNISWGVNLSPDGYLSSVIAKGDWVVWLNLCLQLSSLQWSKSLLRLSLHPINILIIFIFSRILSLMWRQRFGRNFMAYHVCEFMGDYSCNSLFVSSGGHDGVVEQGRLPVCDQTPVLHCPSIEVRQSDLIWGGQAHQKFIRNAFKNGSPKP